jgi:hypothetical protein
VGVIEAVNVRVGVGVSEGMGVSVGVLVCVGPAGSIQKVSVTL